MLAIDWSFRAAYAFWLVPTSSSVFLLEDSGSALFRMFWASSCALGIGLGFGLPVARMFGSTLQDRVTKSFGLVVRAALRPVHIPVQCKFGLIGKRKIVFWM